MPPFNHELEAGRLFAVDDDAEADLITADNPTAPDAVPANDPNEIINEQIRRFLDRPSPIIGFRRRRIGQLGPHGVMRGAENLLRKTHEQLIASGRVDGTIQSNIDLMYAVYERISLYLPQIAATEYSATELRWFSVFGDFMWRFEEQFDRFLALVMVSEGGREYLHARNQAMDDFEEAAAESQTEVAPTNG